MSPSEFARHDFELSFSSSALAVAWQLKLIKGVVHHHGKTSSVERPIVTYGLSTESEGEERGEAGGWGKGERRRGGPCVKVEAGAIGLCEQLAPTYLESDPGFPRR
jgi:hypothetical protein